MFDIKLNASLKTNEHLCFGYTRTVCSVDECGKWGVLAALAFHNSLPCPSRLKEQLTCRRLLAYLAASCFILSTVYQANPQRFSAVSRARIF
jgi:hypothetical protein